MPGRSACIRVKMFGSQSIAALANVPIRTVPTSSPFMRPICAASSSPPRRIRRTLRQILRQSLLLSTVCSSVPIFAVVLLRVPLSGLFTKDPAVVRAACVRILGILLFEPLCNLYEIPAGVLRGSGHALYPAAAAVAGTCVFRIVWIFTVFRTHPTLPVLYRASPLSWAVTIVLTGIGFLVFYRAGGRAGNSR